MTGSVARSIKSAERTLALFEMFSREQRPFTVGYIAKSLSIPQPSVSMLLRNLTELGYLQYDGTARTFSPSIRVALLGSWINRRFGEMGSIDVRLDELQRKVGEIAYLGIQNGSAAQYVMWQAPADPRSLGVGSGKFRSLTCSAMGRVLLSLKSDAEVAAWARRCNAEAKEERLKVREVDFLKLISEVRKSGYARTEGDMSPGMGAIATSFVAPMGGMPMAVGVGGPIPVMREKRDVILQALACFREAFDDTRR
jgi:IclR family KDG regulon transcriptional repressor